MKLKNNYVYYGIFCILQNNLCFKDIYALYSFMFSISNEQYLKFLLGDEKA